MTAPQTFSWMIPTENLKTGSVVAYKSYAQGVEGNWEETELKSFRVESIVTTTTHELVTTTQVCSPEGGACRLNKHCCSGYCCDGVCSSVECRVRLGFNYWYLILIVVFVTVVLIVVLFRFPRKTSEDEFERLKEKWSR